MKTLSTAIVLALAAAFPVHAAVIHSPNTAQTWACHSIQWEQLRWLPGSHSLVASITFSNLDYESRAEPRRDERFDFLLPGVALSDRDGVFYARGKGGSPIPVAAISRDFIGKEIKLLPGCNLEIHSQNGLTHVDLATGGARSDSK